MHMPPKLNTMPLKRWRTLWMNFSTLFCRPHHLNSTVTSL